MKPALYYIAYIIPILVILSACSTSIRVPVEASFLGERVNTTTDSPIAAYYLEKYLQGKKTDPALHQKIAKLYAQPSKSLPTRGYLKQLSKEYSVDFAALYLADSLQKNRDNRKIQRDFNQFLQDQKPNTTIINKAMNEYVILFVPGWDYVANGQATGSDFAEQQRLVSALGIENYLVEVPSNGSVNDIADYLTNDLKKHTQSGKRIIIVGASSAGPSIYLTLAEQLTVQQQASIKAWINLGGILRGSPLVEHYQQFPKNILFNTAVRVKGWDKEKIKSLSATESRKRFERLTAQGGINSNILIINYMGLSLSGQLSIHAQDRYPLLAPEGPNDGLTLLADIIAPKSLTIIAVGSDHFFAEDPRIHEKTIAIMQVVISYLEQKDTKTLNQETRVVTNKATHVARLH